MSIIKNIFCLYLFFLASNSSGQESNHLLWKVENNKGAVVAYLYGTIHSREKEAFLFTEALDPLISECDVFAGEIVYSEIQQSDALKGVFMEDQTLQDLYSEEDFGFVREQLIEKLGINAITTMNMQPVFISSMILELESSPDSSFVLDQYLQDLAIIKGKEIVGLETASDAMDALGEISLEEQAEMLLEFLEDFDEQIHMLNNLTSWYAEQLVDSMYSYYTEFEGGESFDEALILKRNKAFTKNLCKLIKKNKVFCAVGTLHMPGKTGLVEAMRRKGFAVSPVILHNPK
jgi:uncharacterized protein YbaP (TraB family)